MKRFCTLFLMLVMLLCGCSDAEFYDTSSETLRSEESAETQDEGARFCYALQYIMSKNPLEGETVILCKVELSTGIAFPICYDPACLHDGACLATDVSYFNVTDDGKYVYYIKKCHARAGDSSYTDILYVYNTQDGIITELDQYEHNDRQWVLLAFDDGVVYNKCVVTERDEFGNELSFTNTLYKATPDGERTQLWEGGSFLFVRYGQMAYISTEIFDSKMQSVVQISREEGREGCYRAMERPFFCCRVQEADGTEPLYLFSRREDGEYDRQVLTNRKTNLVHLRSKVLIIEKPGQGEDAEMQFVIRCIDPYTGETVHTVDMKERLAALGITDPVMVSMVSADSLQGIHGNYQVLTVHLESTNANQFFLLNADTGEVFPIKLADEWTE